MPDAGETRLEESAALRYDSIVLVPIPAPLARYVKCARYLPAAAITGSYTRLPDGETELLVTPRSVSLVGAQTSFFSKHVSNESDALVVRFRVGGAYPFFGRMSELTDAVVPFEEAGAEHTLRWLTEKLARGDVYEPERGPRLREALASGPPPRTVPELASRIGASERQLRRICDDTIGLAPKQLLRALRLRAALREARRVPRPSWTTIAHASGYYDQAHLIAEFRALMGTTPGAYFATINSRDSARG